MELTSPTTTTTSGCVFSITRSSRSMISAVCVTAVPEPTSQVQVRRGDLQVLEERLGHLIIVVLPGMDQDGFHIGITAHFVQERCNLDEIGSRSNHRENAHSHCP